MLDIIVFSKDRAAQLDLLLRSMDEYLKVEKRVCVLYTYSEDKFKKAYDKIREYHPNVVLSKEGHSFRTSFLNILNYFENEFCVFFTDDDVFINRITDRYYRKMIEMYNISPQTHSISLRMNSKINYCFPAKKDIRPPQLLKEQDHISWDWTKANKHYCWGYPMAVNSHIYETKKLRDVLNEVDFNGVNNLEAVMNCHRYKDKPYMLSFKETKVFNVQNNFVKLGCNSRGVDELNEVFLEGKRIKIKGKIPNTQCHGEVEYETY